PRLRPNEMIVVNMRLPRVILAALVGAVLAIAGACFQGLLKNPLADPYIIGVSSGAAVGVALYVVVMARLGADSAAFAAAHPTGRYLLALGKPAVAFLFAVATMLIVYGLARRDGRISLEGFLLAGVVVGAFMWAIVFFLMTLAQSGLHRIAFFLMGNLQQTSWTTIAVLCVFAAVGIPVLYAFARDLNLMLLGEEPAIHLGVRVESLKHVMVAGASLITAAAVSAAGIIGFAGFIVPHIMRRIVGPDHRLLLPCACLAGAAFLIFADTLARTLLGANEIPTGVVTALIGAPFFCHLLRKRRIEG
ncbi:MAG: FecCD family ABC transporter permease, partial [Armatimonadota bacterium]